MTAVVTPRQSIPTDVAASAPARVTQRIGALNGLRGLAALAIVVSHVSGHSGHKFRGWAEPLLSRLDVGVAVFFVLSGFLLYRPYARAMTAGRPLPPTRKYILNRLVRILPAYWLVALVAFILVSDNRDASATLILQQLTLTQIYDPPGFFSGLHHIWSLDTAVAFYLVLPALAWLVALGLAGPRDPSLPRRHTMVIVALVVIAPLYTAAVETDLLGPPWEHHWLPAYLGWFGVGMAIAVASDAVATGTAGRISRLAHDASSSPGTVYLLAGLAYAVIATPLSGHRELLLGTAFEQVSRLVLLAVVAGLLVLPLALGSNPRSPVVRVLELRPLRWLGDISYGVFLFHLVFLQVVIRWLEVEPLSGRFWTMLALTLGLTIPAAWLSYRLVELPIARRVRTRAT